MAQMRGVPDDQGNEVLERSIRSLDQARAAGLGELLRVEEAKNLVLARDRPRLVEKLGENHPRVQALDENQAVFAQRAVMYRAEAAVSAVTPPQVKEGSWGLHGHVLTADMKPASGVTVALYKKDDANAAAHACTDERGYFQMVIGQLETSGLELSLKAIVKEKQVHTDPAPVTALSGRVEYRRVILGKQADTACDPPPPQKKSRK